MGFFTTTEEALSDTNLQSKNVNINENQYKSENEILKMFSNNTPYELYYEDIMDIIENPNSTVLRNLLTNLVHIYKLIIIKGLNSNHRHKIYNQCYYPLKFEKILEKENVVEMETKKEEEYTHTNILIYNYKIKQNYENENNDEDEKEFIKTETENKEKEEDQEEDQNKDSDTDIDYFSDTDTEVSFITNEESQMEKLENLHSQQLQIISRSENKIDACVKKINYIFLLNAICCIVLCLAKSIRIEIIENNECY